MSYPNVIGPPDARLHLIRGVCQLNKVLRLTLGPHSNRVAISSTNTRQPVDLLMDATTISQRMLGLSHPFENMGHQILRKALDDLGERVGDGAATCSVLTAAILQHAAPLLAAGHLPVDLIHGLQAGLDHAIFTLEQHAQPVTSMEDIQAILQTATIDPRIASMVAEILDTIGPEGSLLVEETRHVGIHHEYVQGARWSGGQASPSLMVGHENQVFAHSPHILVSTVPLATPEHIVRLLELVASTKSRSAMLIAPDYSDTVIGLLVANRQKDVIKSIIAVKSPLSIHYGLELMEDISMLVDAQLFTVDSSRVFRSIDSGQLGQAQRAWVSRSAFGIIGGAGNKAQLAGRIRAIRSEARGEADNVKKLKLLERAGNLTGISAVVRVESYDKSGVPSRKQDVQKAAMIARRAVGQGSVVGGGAALANCAKVLDEQFNNTPYALGAKVLARAMTEPMRTIIANAGVFPGTILEHAQGPQGNGQSFDVLSEAWGESLRDSWVVTRTALEVAVSTASMVLSTDVVVRSGKPDGPHQA